MKTKTLFTIAFTLLTACHSGQKNEPAASNDSVVATQQPTQQPGDTAKLAKEEAVPVDFFSKGTIESVSEVAVTSRINEQIVMLGVEMGQRVQKGQVLARLDRTATEDRILKGRAELEHAEYQYQNILMGQGYKRGAFDQAPENIREMARINSGYNTAKAALRQLEHQLTYCTIQAPISGVVTQLDAVLYATAVPGETLFRIVDTEHLKVCFDILENELRRFGKGTAITVIPISFPDDRYQARVTAISPVVEKSGMIHLEAILTPHPHLMPGMSAIVTLGSEVN
jgi:multidrug efflux system membrane fusion protein